MDEREVTELTGINFDNLACSEKHDLKEVINLTDVNLDGLFEIIYKLIIKKMNETTESDLRGGYPSYLRLEEFKSEFIKRILQKIIAYIKSNFEIEHEELLLDGEKTFRVMLGEEKTVRPDYILYGEKDGTTRYYMAVVEMKRSSPEKGNKQNAIYMKACFDSNGDRKAVYGLCSTATHFNVLRYSPKNPKARRCSDGDFIVSESMRFLFGEMTEFKSDWERDCTTFIRIAYTILYEQLQLNSRVRKVKKSSLTLFCTAYTLVHSM